MSRPSVPSYGQRVNEPWRDDAKCDEVSQSAFIPESAWHSPTDDTKYLAEDICKTKCKVREECLRDALTDPYAEGMRGGFIFAEGKVSKDDVRHIRRLVPDLHIRVKKTKKNDQTIELDEAV